MNREYINKYIQLSWYAQTSICHGNKYKRTQYNLLSIYMQDTIKCSKISGIVINLIQFK